MSTALIKTEQFLTGSKTRMFDFQKIVNLGRLFALLQILHYFVLVVDMLVKRIEEN